MLILPDRPDRLRVSGVDPSTVTVGVASLEWDFESPFFVVVDGFTIHAKENHPLYRNISELHGGRHGRLLNIGAEFGTYLGDYNPHAVIVESNYLRKSVDAFRSLVEAVCVIRNTLYHYNPLMALHSVDPTSVKKAAGAKTYKLKDKKTPVLDALRIHPQLKWEVDIDSLDEHTIDAVAIALYYLQLLSATHRGA